MKNAVLIGLFGFIIGLIGCLPPYTTNSDSTSGYTYAPPLGEYNATYWENFGKRTNSTVQDTSYKSKKKYTTIVTPQVATDKNTFYTASIRPAADSKGLIDAWILEVKNLYNDDIQINWDKTLFINNGQTDGGFMFHGVVYRDRHNQKPNDIVFVKGTLEKKIFPNNKVSMEDEWTHDYLYGDCGVYLVVEAGGKLLKSKLLMNFDVVKNWPKSDYK